MELGGYHERCGGDKGRSQGDAAVRVRELRVHSSNVTDQPIQWRIEMTDRLIVATFNDTNSAYDAASAIKNLKDSGLTEFKLKAGVMVKKDDRGNVSLIEDRNRPLIGTAVGTAAGALIGLIWGGPGVAVGGAIGARQGPV